MNLSNIKNFARIAKHTIIKYSPEILMGLGAGTFVATIVAASKETIKEQEILEEHSEALGDIEFMHVEGDIDVNALDDETELFFLDDKAYKASRRNVYLNTVKETTVNYLPSVILGTTSLACFFGAFGIMKKRYATLVVAYTALEESFRAYRQRVIEDKGADADLYYLTGQKTKEITTKDENGNKVKQKQLILPDGTVASPYAFKFSKYKENGGLNSQWSTDNLINLAYVKGQMDYLNDTLYSRCVFNAKHEVVTRGWIMLNEARDLLGEDGNTTGSVVGWRYSNGEPGCNGYVDFNLVEAMENDPETGEMIPYIFINPNVDGLIYDLIGKKEPKPFMPTYSIWGEDIEV